VERLLFISMFKQNIGRLAYQGLLFIFTGMMLCSFFLSWWTVVIYVPTYENLPSRPSTVDIFGYGLRHNMDELRSYVMDDETPLVKTILAWCYLGLCGLISLLAIFIKTKWRGWLLGLVGGSYLAYSLIAIFIVVQNRAKEFGISLTGLSSATYRDAAEVYIGFNANLQWGFYLACISGAMLLMMSIISKKVN